MSKFFELVKVRADFDGHGDFNGAESLFSLTEQEEYLQKYAENCKDFYELGTLEKVVSDEEVQSVLKNIDLYEENKHRERLHFKTMDATVFKRNEYKNLTLYTKKTKVENGEIIFDDGDCYPIPCAKIVAEEITFLEMEICVGKEYFTSVRGGKPNDVMTGRIIELRKGVDELIKLQIYPDGRIFARLNKKDIYHHQNVYVGTVDFGEYFSLKVEIDDGCFSVCVNGQKSPCFAMKEHALPDTVFFSGGMLPIGRWSVKPLKILAGEKVDVFARADMEKNVEESLGEVKLPFVVGTEKYADRHLVLTKKFSYVKDGRDVILHLDTLDPDGEAYLNGVKIADVDNFRAIESNVTEYIKQGENELRVVVSPRAPEILYSWHKHKDPYNGWFSGNIYLEKRDRTYLERVFIKTVDVLAGVHALASVSVVSDKESEIVISVKIGNNRLAKKSFTLTQGKNELEIPFKDYDLETWSVKNPALYDVTIEIFRAGKLLDTTTVRTGFRTIEQKDGKIFFNGVHTVLKGALLMQFLPPYEETPLNHVCPTDEQIVWQALMAKKMNCNIVRMHQLGYGTNDDRFAKIFDAVGITVVWITRLIDSIATLKWKDVWEQKAYYQEGMRKVINSPSVVMWEGGNEFYLYFSDIDKIFSEYVNGVKEVDDTRLISPVSHLYYGSDAYSCNCNYYQEDGFHDEFFNERRAVEEWNDPLVVRSAHTYNWLLGYGSSWELMRKQSWSAQKALLESDAHAYLVTEYAIIGRQDPDTKEAKKFVNLHSYEHADEHALGYFFENKKELSQSYQALAAKYATKKMLSLDVDGLMWCCLTGGANDAGYLKPPIDFYGYPKLGFYSLRECFETAVCFDDTTDVIWGSVHKIKPKIVCEPDGKQHTVTIEIKNEIGETKEIFVFANIWFDKHIVSLEERTVTLTDGYYKTIFTIE